MPVAPLQPEEFSHLLSEDWDEQRLNDFFRARPANRDVDYWLSRRLPPKTPRDQLLWRTARAAHCFKEDDRGSHLLVAIPGLLSGEEALDKAAWQRLGRELEDSLSYKLELQPGQLKLHSHPVGTEQAHAMGATGWSRLWNGIPDMFELSPRGQEPVPFVWFGTLSTDLDNKSRLEQFFTLTPGLAQACKEPLLRAEGLAEEQGARVSLFPLTAAWNGPSFARMFGLRKLLSQLKEAQGLQAKPLPGCVELLRTGAPALRWQLPEELQQESADLLKRSGLAL